MVTINNQWEPFASPGNADAAFFALVEGGDDTIPAGFARLSGDIGFQTSPSPGAKISATITGTGALFLLGELQVQTRRQVATANDDGEWSMFLLPLPATHFYTIRAANKEMKLKPIVAGNSYILQEHIEAST